MNDKKISNANAREFAFKTRRPELNASDAGTDSVRSGNFLRYLRSINIFSQEKQSRKNLLPERSENLLRQLDGLKSSGIFSMEAYIGHNADLKAAGVDPWEHFSTYGLNESRIFTTPDVVNRVLVERYKDIAREHDLQLAALNNFARNESAAREAIEGLSGKNISIGIYIHSMGNFFMEEIASCLVFGLHQEGIRVSLRNEMSDVAENFDIRIIVGPHEFFFLPGGGKWEQCLEHGNTIVMNVEQIHTLWFSRALPYILKAPLVLDLNFQTSAILRLFGCNVVHFMPGYASDGPYCSSIDDVSGIELLRGYRFSKQKYHSKQFSERPLDIVFVGTQSDRRNKIIRRLVEAFDDFRFLLIYPRGDAPFIAQNYHATSREICAISQRSKIVLNLHRDHLGYFEWHRVVLQGIWQGAVVVSDPCLPNPLFKPSEHFLEENSRHIAELIRWGLSSNEGMRTLVQLAKANETCLSGPGSMRVAIASISKALTEMAER